MQFMFIHTVEEECVLDEARHAEIEAILETWIDETLASGTTLQGSRLGPTTDATTVRVRQGKVVLTDGPFTETKEQVAGYDVVECADMQEAVAVAARHPTSLVGAIEVRPLYEEAEDARLPDERPGTLRYMLIITVDDTLELTRAENEAIGPATDAWVNDADVKGARLFGSRLKTAQAARTVRVSDAQVVVTDGPFAETKEQIAGFDILECTDLDEAIDLATRHPMAAFGALEIRPFR